MFEAYCTGNALLINCKQNIRHCHSWLARQHLRIEMLLFSHPLVKCFDWEINERNLIFNFALLS